MNAPGTLIARIVVVALWAGTNAFGAQPTVVLNVLPTEEALGPGWKRHISILLDPLSNPPEILQIVSPVSDSSKKEMHARIEDQRNPVSGWSHTHFTLETTNGPSIYDVQLDRYRNKEQLTEGFDKLLTLDNNQFRKETVQDLGDAAVFYRGPVGSTLWFRREDCRVWISRVSGVDRTTNWLQDQHLEHLARKLDRQILRGSEQKGASLPQGEQPQKP